MDEQAIRCKLVVLEDEKLMLGKKVRFYMDAYDAVCDQQQALTIQLEKLRQEKKINA